MLTPDQVDDIAARIVERTDNLAVRYSYLFPKAKKQPDNNTQKSGDSEPAADKQEK